MTTEEKPKTKRGPRRSRAEIAADYESKASRIKWADCRDAVQLVLKANELLEQAATKAQDRLPTFALAIRANASTICVHASKADTAMRQALEGLTLPLEPNETVEVHE